MTHIAPDLYRNFAIGFIGAGLVIAATSFDGPVLTSQAQASEVEQSVSHEIDISDEFLITHEAEETRG